MSDDVPSDALAQRVASCVLERSTFILAAQSKEQTEQKRSFREAEANGAERVGLPAPPRGLPQHGEATAAPRPSTRSVSLFRESSVFAFREPSMFARLSVSLLKDGQRASGRRSPRGEAAPAFPPALLPDPRGPFSRGTRGRVTAARSRWPGVSPVEQQSSTEAFQDAALLRAQ